ncbi:hypothetical protein [Streptomyces sp. NPDC059460]
MSMPDLDDQRGVGDEPPGPYEHRTAAEVVRHDLAEVAMIATESDMFPA